MQVSRRGLLGSSPALAFGLGASASGASIACAQSNPITEPMTSIAIPAQVPAKEGLAQLPDTRLSYWDTGGDGLPVVLMHPASGSALIWGYQQPVLARAGYRVISYSRRGHSGSDPVPNGPASSASEDLHSLLAFLDVDRFHIVASAAGVTFAIDYAHSHPDRVISLVYASGLGGFSDDAYIRMLESLRPKGFADMPPTFQELGPSYRASNPEGAEQWGELERKAHTGNWTGQKLANAITFKSFGRLPFPTLMLTGDADLWWPPAALRSVAAHIPDCETLVVPDVGHSVYWEHPVAFNHAVLDFVGRHSR